MRNTGSAKDFQAALQEYRKQRVSNSGADIEVLIAADCRGETASGRSREARARQIVRAEKPQAQDVRATKQARPKQKSKKALESKYG